MAIMSFAALFNANLPSRNGPSPAASTELTETTSPRRCARLIGSLVLYLAMAATIAQESLNLELNRLEPLASGCRFYLLFGNDTDLVYTDLKLDLVFFDKDGIIAGRMAVDAAPLKARKTTVKLFDIPELSCPAIHRVLLNDVLTCTRSPPQKDQGCLDKIHLANRTDIEFFR